jgi:PAS domain S-box-containing protein
MPDSRPVLQKGLIIGSGAIIVLLVFSAGFGYHNIGQLRENDAWVIHTHEVLEALEGVLSTMKDSETSDRGYLITGDDRYLTPYKAAVAAIRDNVQRLKQLTRDNPRQQSRLPRLEEEISAELSELDWTIAVRKQDPEAARQLPLTGEATRVMGALRAEVQAMQQEERDLLSARQRQSRHSYSVAVLTILFTVALGLGMVWLIVYLLHRHLAELQEAEDELARSTLEILRQKDLLAVTLASIGDGVIVTDAQGRVTFLNGEAERLTGWSSRDAAGHPLPAVFHIINERTRQLADNPVEKILRLGTAVGLANHTVLIAKDGRETPIDDSGAPIRHDDGALQGVVLVFRDFTEQKRTERSLARLAAIVESSDDAILSRDLNGVIQTWNAGAARLFGYRAEEIIGQPITLLLPPERIEEEEQILKRLLSGQRVEHLETVRLTKNGRRVDVSVTVSPVNGEDGQIIGASKIVRDIGERKRAEAELKTAKDAADAANLAKSQFLANMSHELRTPMNAILGMIDVALPKATDPTVQDCLQTAKGSADLLLTLLNDLLDSAKIESGKLELESAAFSLRRMLDQIARVLSVRASEKGLYFHCRMPEGTPDGVIGDRVRLQQVLLNLAGNAIKFTERGEVGISLRGTSNEGTTHLEFAVQDTGIGIPLAGQERLFQPFAQADASMARRFGGTGLGLSICKSLVEMMGGGIWVESEPGKGSTFFFTVELPLAAELPADFETPVVIPTTARVQLRILLAEDNPTNQKLATYILQDRGHLVDIAGDGQEAVRLAGRNRYNVILMDVQMPRRNGLEATAEIRGNEDGHSRVPIIAMTAHAMKADRERCLAAGMNAYLSKPIDGHEMIALVETLAAGSFSAAAGADLSPATPPQAATASTAVVFDFDVALKRCSNSPEIMREMIQCFVSEAEKLLPQMHASIERSDIEEISRLGHRIKGTVVYLGAEPATQAALRVERCCECNGGTLSEAQQAVDALQRECMLLRTALDECPLLAGPRQLA